jgi:biopolymer transport protein TolR
MPGVVSRGRGRRAISEINMVPFIDVMLVLLIIFMVSAPLITTGVVDLPSMGKARQRPPSVIEVIVGTDEHLKIRIDKADPEPTSIPQLAARITELQAGRADVPVIIAAEAVRYESVVKVMDTLQRAGVQRVGLAVKQVG